MTFQLKKTLLYIQFVVGTVKFTGFLGANGYSIIIEYGNLEITYAHVSPNFLVKTNDIIFQNEIIGNIGPKIVNTKTPYKDSNGNYLNGLTTGSHLHLGIKKDGIAVNPLDYF